MSSFLAHNNSSNTNNNLCNTTNNHNNLCTTSSNNNPLNITSLRYRNNLSQPPQRTPLMHIAILKEER